MNSFFKIHLSSVEKEMRGTKPYARVQETGDCNNTGKR